jgi:hypothetical protein
MPRQRRAALAAAAAISLALAAVTAVATQGAGAHAGATSSGEWDLQEWRRTPDAAFLSPRVAVNESDLSVGPVAVLPPPGPSAVVSRIAFGSCNNQHRPQRFWPAIAARKPDLFAYLGDIVYADRPVFLKIRIPASKGEIAAAYRQNLGNAGYSALLAKVPVVGVWVRARARGQQRG